MDLEFHSRSKMCDKSFFKLSMDATKVYRSTRYVFIHCLWLEIEFYVNLKPWIIDPAISNANLETLAKLDTFIVSKIQPVNFKI